MRNIKVAAVGLGNCASSLIQGIKYYGDKKVSSSENCIPGIMHTNVGPYSINNIQFVPEPATLMLLGIGGLLIHRKK